MIIDSNVIVLDQLRLSMLSQIKIHLGEDILETLMVVVYCTPVSNEVMSPYLKSMYHRGKLKITGRVILFMLP
jgi:hypothetical protein